MDDEWIYLDSFLSYVINVPRCPLGQRRVFLAHVGGVKLVSMNGKYCSLIKNKELEMMPDDIAWGVDAVKIGPGRLASVVVALPDGTVRLFQVI